MRKSTEFNIIAFGLCVGPFVSKNFFAFEWAYPMEAILIGVFFYAFAGIVRKLEDLKEVMS